VKLELFPLRTIRFAEHDTHSPKTCYIGNLLHRKQWELSLLRLVDNIRGDNHC